jgi:CheY-like chemotaxis protein
MQVNCPHCQKQLKLSGKIRESIEKLDPGQKIKVKCVYCTKPFALDALSVDITAVPKDIRRKKETGSAVQSSGKVRPPAPPDVSWLAEGLFDDQEVIEDIPRALVLMPEIPAREMVVKAAVTYGYQVEQAKDATEAIERMRFVNYSAVFLHSRYESGGISSGKFHKYMRTMSMSRRRYVLYALLGDEFETLYDLQALAYSANLVVNEQDLRHIGVVLKKVIPEYETLFGPLMEELRISGK